MLPDDTNVEDTAKYTQGTQNDVLKACCPISMNLASH